MSVSSAESLRRRITKLETELARLESLPEDDFEEGAVITFKHVFAMGGKTYHYAAIKAAGLWYTSGPQGGGVGRTWDHLIDWITSGLGDPELCYVTEVEEVPL